MTNARKDVTTSVDVTEAATLSTLNKNGERIRHSSKTNAIG